MNRRHRRERRDSDERPALFTINLDSDGEEVPAPNGSPVAPVSPHVPPVSVFAGQFIISCLEACNNANTKGIVCQPCPVIWGRPHPEMGLCDLGQPQPPADVEDMNNIDEVKVAVDMHIRNQRIKSRKAKDQQAQCDENMHNERLQIARDRVTMTSEIDAVKNEAEIWEARTATAREIIEQAKRQTAAENVEKTEALRARYREAVRDVNARGGPDAQCKGCYDTAYDAYAVGIQGGKLSQDQIDTLLADFAKNPENRVIYQRTEMMTMCTEDHYLCCLCTGALLQKPGPVFSRQIDCPVVGCAGKLATSGPKSMVGMAHTKEEADQLARHVNYVPEQNVQEEVRPDLVRAWKVHDHLIQATNGTVCCPGCLTPGTFSEMCAHYTCDTCGAEFCAWCMHPGRSQAEGDYLRFPEIEVYPGAITYVHTRMCHKLLWAAHFITYWRHQTSPLDYCKFVTAEALLNNFHGATSIEHGSVVTGILQDNYNSVFQHWTLSVPDDNHTDNQDHVVPDCGLPVENLDPLFARMWGDGNKDSESYVTRGNWRRDFDVEVGEKVGRYGYHEDSLRLISMSVVHFTQHCNDLENWLHQQIRLFKRPKQGLKLARIKEIFEHARRLRCCYECLVPWQVLMAMRVHQLRLDPIYNNGPAGSAGGGEHPDISYEPFPRKWEMTGNTSVPIFSLVPYFNAQGYREGGNFFMRGPGMGFPFVNPHEISVGDLAQSGVVYEQVVEEREPHRWKDPQAWEFSLQFHHRYLAEMDKHAATHEAGPMPPKLTLPRGLDN